MVLKMYSIFDKKSEIHHPPAFCHNTGHALRHFMTVFNDGNNMLNNFPEDFQIIEIGTFDDATAKVTACEPCHIIANGIELIQRHEIVDDREVKNDDA